MKTINATLLASQKLPTGRGYATATLADNGRLHPTQVGSAVYTGGRTVAVECGSFYVRLRFMGGALHFQKITDPTVASQWTTWTSLVAAGVAGSLTIGIFWTGAYVVVVYQELATGDVKWRRSTNTVSWTAAATVRAAASNVNLAGVSAASPACGVMEATGGQIYWQAYNAASNTWAVAESAGAVFSTQMPQIAAYLDPTNARYVVAVAVQGYATWAFYSVVIYTRAAAAPTWSTGRIAFSGNGLGGSFIGLNLTQRSVGGYAWLSFYRFHLWNVQPVTNFFVSASNDGLYWDDPLPTPLPGNELTMTILPPPSGGQWAQGYMGLESSIWRLDTYTYWTGATVVAYRFGTGRGGHQEGGGPNGRGGESPTIAARLSGLTLLLDNRAGQLAAPRLFSVLTLTRGLVVAGVHYGQSAGVWYVTGWRYLLADGLLEVTAVDARGLLSSWFADTAYSYRGATVKSLVEWVCALAGVHSVTFDGFAAWSDVISSFTHAVAENAEFSLRSLAERVPFEYVVQEDGSLSFYVPTAAPSPGYTFGDGAGEHRAWLAAPPRAAAQRADFSPAAPRLSTTDPTRSWSTDRPPWWGAGESVTYLQDIGSPPRNRVVEAIDLAAIAAAGRRRTLIVNDRRLTTDAANSAAAAALLVAAQERKRSGVFECPPSFALEPGDVVAFSAPPYAAGAGPWRVDHFSESFNLPGAQPFMQQITVRGTA